MLAVERSIYTTLYNYVSKGMDGITLAGEPFLPSMIFDSILTFLIILLLFYVYKIFFKKRIKLKLNDLSITIILFLFSFIIRLIFINNGFMHHDSVQLANAIHKTFELGYLYPTQGGRYGIVIINIILLPIFKLFTQEDIALNLITALFGALAVPFMYLFVKELTDKYTGVVSALLLTLNLTFMTFTTYATNHGISVFFVLLSAYMLVKSIKTQNWKYKLFFGLFFGFSLFTRPTNLFYIIPFFLLYIFSKNLLGKQLKQKKSDALYLTFILLAILLLIVDSKNILLTYDVNVRFSEIFLDRFVFTLNHLLQSITLVGTLLVLLSLSIFAIKKDYPKLILFLAWILIPLVYFGTMAWVVPRWLFPIIIPSIILAAIGISNLRNIKPLSVVALLTILIIMTCTFYPILHLRHNYCGPKQAAIEFRKISSPNDIIIANDYGVFYEYYAKRTSLRYPVYGNEGQLKQVMIDLMYLMDNNVSIFTTRTLIGAFHNYNDPTFKKTLDYNFELEKVSSLKVEDYHNAENSMFILEEEFLRLKRKHDITKARIFHQ